MNSIANFFGIIDWSMVAVGATIYKSYQNILRYLKFFGESLKFLPLVYRNINFTVEQMHVIGTESVLLVSITSVFTGGVGAFTFLTQFGDYIPLRYVGAAVGSTVIVAVGPVLTGLVVTGRVGAAIASEIGTMVVTEQVDAMRCLNLNPFRFLIAPRLVAGMIMVPVLNIYSTFIAILGAFAILLVAGGISSDTFFSGIRMFYTDWGLFVGLFKSFIFGIIIVSFGCFYGFFCTHGAEGVGRAARTSVVISDIFILITAFIIDRIFL
jgi:phospholipid/cholesterol/gamma-HCH transport system permease protein